MKKWISILSVLLVVQIVLALWLNLSGEEHGAFQAEEQLLTFDKQAVDALQIEGDESKVLLQKQGDKWQLPESNNFPAEQGSVARLLDRLADMKKGWPVATTGSAAERFKVDEKAYERKLTLSGEGGTLAELYVGSSPGLRKTHVRRLDDDAIFAVEFNSWEVGAKVDDWIDKSLLKLDPNDIVRVQMPGFTLQREGDVLKLTDQTENEETAKEETGSLIDKLAGLRVDGLLGTTIKPEYQQEKPEMVIQLQREKEGELTYTFSKPKDGDHYVLRRSDQEYYFKIAEHSLKPIKEATREKLVKTKIKEEDGGEPAKEERAPAESEQDKS